MTHEGLWESPTAEGHLLLFAAGPRLDPYYGLDSAEPSLPSGTVGRAWHQPPPQRCWCPVVTSVGRGFKADGLESLLVPGEKGDGMVTASVCIYPFPSGVFH